MIELGKPTDIDASIVSKLVTSIGYRLDFVLLAGYLPYQETLGGDNISINRLATRSPLDVITDLYKMVTESFAVPVHMMLESLAELPVSSISALSEALCLKPYLVDAKSFIWVRRRRLFWIMWDVQALAGERIENRDLHFQWNFPFARGARDAWVDSGGCWEGCSRDSLPVFTRPRPRTTNRG